MDKDLIIDCHSHIGQDYYWRNSSIDEYLKVIDSQNIDVGLLMPVPGQTFPYDSTKRYFIWSLDKNMKLIFSSDDEYQSLNNPYRKVNDYVSNIILNAKTSKHLEFIPLIHPILDTEEYLISLVAKYHPLALKIHGVACGIGPKDISKEYIDILKQISLPIIVHTDYCHNPKVAIDYIRIKNNPYDWAMFFIENNLQGYLTHGCRMDINTLHMVNDYDNLVVGIGPDLKISNERFRWVNQINDKEYLQVLKNELELSKIMFDIDYSWNIDNNNNIDYSAINRLTEYFNDYEMSMILSKNPNKFFKIKERIINEKNTFRTDRNKA